MLNKDSDLFTLARIILLKHRGCVYNHAGRSWRASHEKFQIVSSQCIFITAISYSLSYKGIHLGSLLALPVALHYGSAY